jgi:predicted nucleic acid-binding protein
MAGLRRDTRATVRRALTALPVAVPTEDTWRIVERWVETASDAGERFGLIDLLIAALTHEMTGLVWSLDRDFERMATLGLVQTYH